MEEDPSSCTAGMDIVFTLVCPEGGPGPGEGTWRRTHHRALQVWMPCLLLCVLKEDQGRVSGHGGGPIIVNSRYGYRVYSCVS